MNSPILKATQIKKHYRRGPETLEILKGIDFEIQAGDACSIVGSSGAGKSTFLHILGTLDKPTWGEIYFLKENLLEKTDSELARFRNKSIGFVFQFHHLLPEFTALENIAMPGQISGMSKNEAKERASELVEYLGLEDRIGHYPSQMSGGEQQRVAIARALFNKPAILMADEPTGNLDTENSERIQELFFKLKDELNLTLIVVTHDILFAQKFPEVREMKDGYWG